MSITRRKAGFLMPMLILLMGVVLFALNLLMGSVSIPFADFIDAVFYHAETTSRSIVVEYRLPQAITAVFAGIGLSVSGLLMQTLFRNPLADPSILGISSGAGLGVAFSVLLAGSLSGMAISRVGWWTTIGIATAAFLGAFVVLLLILAVSMRLRNMIGLILVGIMIAYIASSVTDVLKFFSQKEDVHSFVIWGMGSFSAVTKIQLPFLAACISLGVIAAFFLSKTLNLMLLGDRYAENLGVNTKHSSMLVILVSGFLTAVVTAFCGPIAFLGLAVPHIARFLFRTSNHKILIPFTVIIGMDLALLCNLIARLPGFEGNLPINSVTALIGAPIVIWVIFHRQKVLRK